MLSLVLLAGLLPFVYCFFICISYTLLLNENFIYSRNSGWNLKLLVLFLVLVFVFFFPLCYFVLCSLLSYNVESENFSESIFSNFGSMLRQVNTQQSCQDGRLMRSFKYRNTLHRCSCSFSKNDVAVYTIWFHPQFTRSWFSAHAEYAIHFLSQLWIWRNGVAEMAKKNNIEISFLFLVHELYRS